MPVTPGMILWILGVLAQLGAIVLMLVVLLRNKSDRLDPGNGVHETGVADANVGSQTDTELC